MAGQPAKPLPTSPGSEESCQTEPCRGTTQHLPPFPSHHRLLLTDDDRQHPHGLPLPAVDLGPLPTVSCVWVLEVWVGDSLDPVVHHIVPGVLRAGVRVALLWLQSGLLPLDKGCGVIELPVGPVDAAP